ncbi:DNA ligase, partial [Haematococcus lacustris]
VWELCGAELTLSPVHRGAAGRVPDSDRGLGLRFPRFLRVRDDKGVEDATGPDMLLQLYLKQQRRATGGPSTTRPGHGRGAGEADKGAAARGQPKPVGGAAGVEEEEPGSSRILAAGSGAEDEVACEKSDGVMSE